MVLECRVAKTEGALCGGAKAGQDLGDGAQQRLLKLKKQIIVFNRHHDEKI